MTKYCDLYYSIRNTPKGYVWYIRTKDGDILQSSLDNENEEDQCYTEKQSAETDCREAIEDYYR
jgi:hypothetical protein